MAYQTIVIDYAPKAKSMAAKLARGTKWVAAVFVVLTLVLDCMVAAGISTTKISG